MVAQTWKQLRRPLRGERINNDTTARQWDITTVSGFYRYKKDWAIKPWKP